MHHKLEDIKVWSKAIQLSTDIYEMTQVFPSVELQTQLLISFNLNYLSKEQKDIILNNIYEIQKMIFGFIQSLEKSKV